MAANSSDRTRLHQRSTQTASRRSTYLLYSPNKVMKPGSERTASVDQPDLVAEHLAEFVAGAAHVPVAGDQPHRLVMVPVEPARRLLGIGAGVDRFAAEIDAATEQSAARRPAGGRCRALVTDGSAPATSRRFALPALKHLDAMLDPPAAAGQDDHGVGRAALGRRRLAEREREQDEAERIER